MCQMYYMDVSSDKWYINVTGVIYLQNKQQISATLASGEKKNKTAK